MDLGLLRISRLLALIGAMAAVGLSSPAVANTCGEHDHDGDGDGEHQLHERQKASERVEWRDRPSPPGTRVSVKLLGFNDFHGQITKGKRVARRPVGSAPVFASYLKAAQQGPQDATFIAHAGDIVGASPPASSLLLDEPTLSFLNMLGNEHCESNGWLDPHCNMVGTLGNHEFDLGRAELLRKLHGGNHALGPYLEPEWKGVNFPYVSANAVDAATGEPILPPYVIKRVKGVPIAFIGALLKNTPSVVTASGVAGMAFLDEAQEINRHVAHLKAINVRTIIVLIHEGGVQRFYSGETKESAGPVSGDIAKIIKKLDDEVDVVISGHRHAFTNALVPNNSGKKILVTQAYSSGTAYSDIDLELDLRTKDVISKSAAVITTWADSGPGKTPDAEAQALVDAALAKVGPIIDRVVSHAAVDHLRTQNTDGESRLGNLIADAQRAAMGSDFAFMNPGGIRDDILTGPVTWGQLFTVQPFGNYLVRMDLTGADIYALLEQQWTRVGGLRYLQISGLTYEWSASQPNGSKIVVVRKDGVPIDPAATYSVTVNSFLAPGGDGFPALANGTNRVNGPVDLDALVAYIEALPSPFFTAWGGRIARVP